jgi:hypothetical protein
MLNEVDKQGTCVVPCNRFSELPWVVDYVEKLSTRGAPSDVGALAFGLRRQCPLVVSVGALSNQKATSTIDPD